MPSDVSNCRDKRPIGLGSRENRLPGLIPEIFRRFSGPRCAASHVPLAGGIVNRQKDAISNFLISGTLWVKLPPKSIEPCDRRRIRNFLIARTPGLIPGIFRHFSGPMCAAHAGESDQKLPNCQNCLVENSTKINVVRRNLSLPPCLYAFVPKTKIDLPGQCALCRRPKY